MKFSKASRRRFLWTLVLAAPAIVVADVRWIEPRWIKVRMIRLAKGKPSHRLVHFTDLHHKGDRKFTEAVVRKINHQSPDFVCFTGDLIGDPVENPRHLDEALEILSKIKSPLYGVPGNHEYWSKIPFKTIGETFAATGGRWLLDQQVLTLDGEVAITGLTCQRHRLSPISPVTVVPDRKNVLLTHYPAWVKKLGVAKFDLILAGHSHGGQVRLPFIGPPVLAFAVDEYDIGLFETPNGPLYVNPGIGWFATPIRFRCRPEITVIEI